MTKLLPDGSSLYAFCDRHALLKHLPKGGVGCEIGVFAGDNAKFLRTLEPKKLTLIDPWAIGDWPDVMAGRSHSIGMPLHQDARDIYDIVLKRIDPSYAGGSPDTVFEKLYQRVCDHFAEDRTVEIVRKQSDEAHAQFDDGTFDFIYVDGDHSFNAVYNDLLNYEKKLKTGGVLIGNDYLCSIKPVHAHYGVIPAVTQFCKVRGYRIIVLCHGEYADFVLAKSESDYVENSCAG